MVELLGVQVELTIPDVALGLVVAKNCDRKEVSAEFEAELSEALQHAKDNPERPEITKPVRDLLRHGRYKPTGRGKPASEYLLRSAAQDKFPRVFPLVDIINLVSLKYLLPISLIDLNKAGTENFNIRRGREDESYVFNAAGQGIGLQDLLLVSKGPRDHACANPVKDSMSTKLDPEATDALAVVYAPPELSEHVEQATALLGRLFERDGGADAVATECVVGQPG